MAIITIGMSCYDQFFYIPNFPEENRKVFSYNYLQSGGGPCGNASYLLALWGEDVYHITTLKNDINGLFVANELQGIGVNLDYSLINTDQITCTSTILVNKENASRTIITNKNQYDKVISKQDREKLDQFIDDLNQQQITHLILIDGHEYELSDYFLSKLTNKIVIMDAGNVRDSNLKLAKYTNYLVASENFSQDLIGEKDLMSQKNQLKALKEIGKISHKNNTPVITLGEKGVIALINNKIHHYPSYNCLPIDTTGAGDIFHGAFCYGIYLQWDIEKTIYFSSLTAAISIEHNGVRSAIPKLVDVDQARLGNLYTLKK